MSDRGSSGLQTLLVGIDAGCRNVLEPLFEAGATPTLASLFENGASGRLESQIPPWTASAWPSLYTGTNPGKHGVFGFLSFDGYDWGIVNGTHVREPSLWELLDHNGLSSVVVNVPVTHPATEIDGAVIPGYVAPENPDCHPAGILDEVREEIGEYRIYTPSLGDGAKEGEKIAEYRSLIASRGEAFRYLVERVDPDFGFLQFQVTDTVLHEFPGDRDRVRQVYEVVDQELAATLDACDPDTTIVASDHGMDAYDTRFRINEQLRDSGYVESTQGGIGMPTWAKIRDGQLVDGKRGDDSVNSDRGLVESAMEAAAAVGLTSQRVGRVLDRLGLTEHAMRLVPDDAIRAASEQVDFPNSTAYMRTRVECGVRINLDGREPDGVVAPAEYDRVRDRLIEELREVRAPNGEPVFDAVGPREAFFEGPQIDRAPDVVTVPTDFRYYLTTWLLGERFEEPAGPAWDHTLDGIVAATGDGIDHDAELSHAHLFDVAPTVLASLGVPASDRMDGKPLPFVDGVGTEAYPETESEKRAVGSGDVEERLADLGYIE